ncbi:hypothetical protein ACFSTH_10695 [Paenibacillus yanchengensis]|uniref:Uncharacterized protein n=1 Tax=Paenibacillus yanchengensis TaxID=2035833 RepID=A0ABW4YJL7_9BACL
MKQILIFVLFSAMLCWVMFSPIYKHVAIARQAALQQEVDYLLEVGASGTYGYIDARMQRESRARLEKFGLQSQLLQYELFSTSGSDPSNAGQPLSRGTGIALTISYPYENLFTIDRLIGITSIHPNERMRAFGMKMSEYMK